MALVNIGGIMHDSGNRTPDSYLDDWARSGGNPSQPAPGGQIVGGGSQGGGGQPGGSPQVGGGNVPTPAEILADVRAGRLSQRAATVGLIRYYTTVQGLPEIQARTRATTDLAGLTVPPNIGTGGPPAAPGGGTTPPPGGGMPGGQIGGQVPLPSALLEEIFGSEEARRAQFREFAEGRFGRPAVTGTFRNVFSRLQDPLSTAFQLRGFQSGAPEDFGTFLAGQSSLRPFAGGSSQFLPQLRGAADVLGMDPTGSAFQGFDPERQNRIQALQEVFGGPGGQRSQFNLASEPFAQNLPVFLRDAFRRRANDEFERILASQGQDPNFQTLPFLAERGFRIF